MSDFLLLGSPWYLEASNWIAFAKAAFGVGLVIFVHELGHFLVAKACGVKCEKFYIGFDPPIKIGPLKLPRSLAKFQWGETEYGIGIIPLGGYVKMLGQDDNPGNAAAEAERTKVRKENTASEAEGSADEKAEGSADEKAEGVVHEVEPAKPQVDEEFELDPRSYPAKSVPQRMAIISAGVIMNVITAVLFASLAYGIGVNYMPCVVGDIVPGEPAWNAGLRPGDRIVSLNDEPTSYNLRWQDDLLKAVAFNAAGEPLAIVVDRPGETDLINIDVLPRKMPGRPLGTVGVTPSRTNVVAAENFVVEGMPSALAEPAFEGGDVIVAINGAPVENGIDFEAESIAHQDESITVTVERSKEGSDEPEQIDITVGPTPFRGLGLQFAVQPIGGPVQGSTGVQPGSPADGVLKDGDLITAVNGEPVADALRLPDDLRRLAGQTVTLTIRRDGEPLEVEITPELSRTYTAETISQSLVNVGSLGVVFPVKPVVAGVLPGSPAAEAGMEPGDELKILQYVAANEKNAQAEAARGTRMDEFMLGEKEQPELWLGYLDAISSLLPETQVRVVWERRDEAKDLTEIKEATFEPVTIEDYTSPRRGIVFVGDREVHKAGSVGEAFALGFRQAKEDFAEVFTVFKMLFTGGLSPKALGGPGTIAVGATMEATQGIARLLLFMTLISVNLAVINFLPIPVLDGGHMVFLAYEGIRGKPVDERIAFRLTLVGLSFILLLMVFVLSLDAMRIGGMLFSS